MQVSIIITNYNYAAYVGQAIDSALSQSHAPVEVIVVDDGSTDGSRAVIEASGPRIHPVFKSNGGLGSAYNAGWRQAKGDMIIFLDADDMLLPGAVEKCVAAMTGANIVKAQFLLKKVDKDGGIMHGIMPTYGLGHGGNVRRDIALWGYYLSPPASGNAYRRDFLEATMPVPEMPKATHLYDLPADGYLCGLAGLMGEIATIPEILGLYRVHGTNMSDAGQIETVHKLRQLFMVDYLREHYQQERAAQLGLPYLPDRSRFHPTVCKQRFLAYRLEPKGHPVPGDTRLGLFACGLWGAVCFPYLTLQKRLFIAGGFIAIAVLPRRLLQKMIQVVTKPEKRKGWLGLWRS